MPLELQLQRTTGTVYGEIMRDSGITLPNGRYISGNDFVLELINHGVVPNRSAPEILKDLHKSPDYGNKDDIWTGLQFHIGIVRYFLNPFMEYFRSWEPSERAANYNFNPWRELMKGNLFGTVFDRAILDRPSVFRAMYYNPKKGVERVRDMYVPFANLPRALQDDFLDILESYPCNLHINYDIGFHAKKWMMPVMDGYYPELDQSLSRMAKEIMKIVPKECQQDMFYVLNLLAFHSICVGKGELIRRQIEELMGYDTRQIPMRWEKGHLKKSALAKKQTELSNLLADRKIVAV